MSEDRPPTYDELLSENRRLAAEVKDWESALTRAINQLQGVIRQKNEEINTLRSAAPPERPLDANAADAFNRPYMGQVGRR